MQDIKTIIWDLDNTLYKFDPKMMEGWNYQAARYLIENGLKMSFEETYSLVKKGWDNHKDSIHYFNNYQKKDMCKFVDKNLCPSHITPCPTTPELFKDFNDHKQHVILTMAETEWAHRVLNHIKLNSYFQNNYIIGAEQYDYESKSETPRGILLALDKSNAVPEKTMFVEDTLANLKPAKDNGVKTVYLHHDRPLDGANTAFVDLIVKDTPELLRHMASLGQAA